MNARAMLAALVTATAAMSILPGCAISRGQSSVGEYIDDSVITTQVKARLIENKVVDASAISVETLNGTVLLSGFAVSEAERSTAATLARSVKGVTSVRNEVVVRR